MSMTPAERQAKRRAKLRAQGLSIRGRPLDKARRKRKSTARQDEQDALYLLKVCRMTKSRMNELKREASANLARRTSNWRITRI